MKRKKENQQEADRKGKQRMEKFEALQETKKEESPTPKVGKRIIAYQKIEPGDWGPLYED